MKPFIPAWLDDARLSPRAFRVLAHLWRRRNVMDGRCNPSVASIASACCLHRETVWAAISELEGAALLARTRKGRRASNQYDLATLNGGKNRPVKRAELAGKTGHLLAGKTGHLLAGKTGHQGYPEKVPQEGESQTHSLFASIVAEVEAMPEFANRSDVGRIAEIIGEGRLRNAAHLAARVRDEHRPRYHHRKPIPKAGFEEPKGWREYLSALPEGDWRREYADRAWASLPETLKGQLTKPSNAV